MDKTHEIKVKYSPEIDEAALSKAKSQIKFDSATVKVELDAAGLKESLAKITADYEANKKTIADINAELKQGKTLTEDQSKAYSKAKDEVNEQKKSISDINTKLKGASDSAKDMGDSFTKAGLSFDGITGSVAKIGLAISGIQQIAGVFDQFLAPYKEFDKQLKNIGTLGVQNFEGFRTAAIDLASQVPDTVAGVTEAVYNAISAGAIQVVDGQADIAGGMLFIEQASRLAVAGMTDTNSAVKSLASATNAYGSGVLSAGEASDILFATVKNGVTTIPELNASLSNVVPIAAAAGVSFEQVGAAIATMTKQGVPTAQATTQIRAAIAELMKPGANLKKVMDEAGVSMATLKQDGLQETMKKLGDAMGTMGTDSANTFSSIEAISFALASTGDNALKAASDLEAIKAGAGSVNEAFAIANEGIGVQVQGVLNQIEAVAFKAFGTMGDGAVVAVDALNKIAPTAMGLASIGQILPLSSVKTFSLTILKTLVPSLVTANAATGALSLNTQALSLANIKEMASNAASMAVMAAKTVATWAVTAAQWAWNAAMSANPIGLLVVGIAAAIGAVKLLSDALTTSTAERGENLKQEQILLDNQMKSNEAQQSKLKQQELMIEQYELLGSKTARTAEEEKNYRDVQLELSKTFPGVISGSATFAENLARVKAKSDEGKESLAKLKDEYKNLETKKVDLKIEVDKNNAQKVVEDMQDVISSFWTGTDFKAKKGMDDYIKSMKAATSSADLESIATDFKMAIFNDKAFANLDEEEKNKMIALAGKLQASLADGLAATDEKAILAVRNLVSDTIEKGAEVSPEALAKIAEENKKPIEEIRKMFDEGYKVATDNKMSDLLASAFTIDKKIDNTAMLDELVKTYETASARLDELKNKQGSEGLTTNEQQEFDALSKKAKEAADSISAIVPTSKEGLKLVADENGKLVESYDLNIAKVQEYSAAQKASLTKTKESDEYMALLAKQGSTLGEQKQKLIELKSEIDKTTDPKAQQTLREEYDKTLGSIQTNANALVDGYYKGSQAGLLTKDAVEKLAKSLDISNESAQKLLVAKALEDASKAGKVTEEQVNEIAKKFGYSAEEAKKMLAAQEKQTAEAKATADAVKSIGKQYEENKKKQEESFGTDKTDLIGLIDLQKQLAKEGKSLTDEQIKQKKEIELRLKSETQTLKSKNAIEAQINKQYDASYKEASKAATAERQSYLTSYNADKARLDLAYQKSQALQDQYRTEVGLQKTAFDDISASEEKLIVLNKQKEALTGMVTALGGAINSDNQISIKLNSSFTQKDKDEVQKELDAVVKDMNKQSGNIDSLSIKADVDVSKANETIDKLRDDAGKRKLALQLEIGTLNKAEYDRSMIELAKADLVSMQTELDKLNQKLRIADPIQAANVQKDIDAIGEAMNKKNKDIADYQGDLLEAIYAENLSFIKDSSERERMAKLHELAITYDKQLKLAKGNKDAELKVINEFARKESEINADYAEKNMSFKARTLIAFSTAISSALSNITLTDTSQDANKAKEQVAAIDDQMSKLDESFKTGEKSYADYVNNLNSLDKERASAHKEATNQSLALVKSLNSALSQSFASMAQSSTQNIALLTEQFQTVSQDMTSVSEKIKTTFDPNELDSLYTSMSDMNEKSASIMGEAWSNFGVTVGATFSQMLAQGNSFLKSTVVAMLGALKAMIPIYIAQLYAKELAEKSFWGIATATALTATLVGVVSAAEAAVKTMKFAEGGEIPIGERLITVNERGQEFVMNHMAYQKNRDAFLEINRRNISVEQYAREKKLIDVDKSMRIDTSGIERRLMSLETGIDRVRKAVDSSTHRTESHVAMEFNDKELISRYHVSRTNRMRSF